MKSAELSFDDYLRGEVDNAGKGFERARKKVFALTDGPEIERGPALLEATELLSEAMQVYVNALRRLAHYAAHQAQPTRQRELTHHA